MNFGFDPRMFAGAGHGHGGMHEDEEEVEEEEVDTVEYYETLGVSKTATQQEIKKAYMKLARDTHPDRGGDVEHFKLVQTAYETLSDAEKRESYDRFGAAGEPRGGAPTPEEFLASMMFGSAMGGGGGAGRHQPQGPQKGEPTVHPLKVSLEDCYSGKSAKIAVTKTVTVEDKGGQMMDRSTGKRYSQRTEREVLDVMLERGTKHGQRLVFAGKGDTQPGLLPSDIALVVQVKDHALFQRRGADLVMKKEISLLESLVGFRFVVEHLDGHRFVVCSKPGVPTPHEAVREIKGEGMPIFGHSHVHGCLYIQFAVKWPETLQLTQAMQKVLIGILSTPGAAPPVRPEVGVPDKELEEVNLEARAGRERLAKEGYDSDEEQEGAGGGRGVACAQQ